MSEYTAKVVPFPDGDPAIAFIDVKPPFAPSDHFLGECSIKFGTILEHIVTTANTTRLYVEDMSDRKNDDVRIAAFTSTALFIAAALNAVDRGEYWPDIEAPEFYEHWPETHEKD